MVTITEKPVNCVECETTFAAFVPIADQPRRDTMWVALLRSHGWHVARDGHAVCRACMIGMKNFAPEQARTLRPLETLEDLATARALSNRLRAEQPSPPTARTH